MWFPLCRNLKGLVAPDVSKNLRSPGILPHVVKGFGHVALERVVPPRHLIEGLASICLQFRQDPQHSKAKAVGIMP